MERFEDDAPSPDPMTVTLERTARELRAIVESVNALEHAVGVTLNNKNRPKDAHIQELQKLDSIRQKVGGLADFLEALNETLPPSWRVDAGPAARCVTLADMAARLGGEDDDRLFAPPESYELF